MGLSKFATVLLIASVGITTTYAGDSGVVSDSSAYSGSDVAADTDHDHTADVAAEEESPYGDSEDPEDTGVAAGVEEEGGDYDDDTEVAAEVKEKGGDYDDDAEVAAEVKEKGGDYDDDAEVAAEEAEEVYTDEATTPSPVDAEDDADVMEEGKDHDHDMDGEEAVEDDTEVAGEAEESSNSDMEIETTEYLSSNAIAKTVSSTIALAVLSFGLYLA